LPHVPCFASQKWFDLFPPESQIKLPAWLPNDRADVPFFSWYLHWDLPEPRLSWLKKENQWQNLVRSYLASTTFMDSQIGRLLDALDASGEASNTVVVLWSDNGWHLGEKDITGKNSLWKPSTRVPLILAGPGVISGGRCAQPAELLDIYPTLIDLCGFPAKPDLEGHSLKPQLKNDKAKRQWPAITTANQNNHSIVTDKWRFIQYADGSQELYNDQIDPNEWNNLAPDPKYKEVIGKLKKWLPKINLPLAPGSANRILEQKDGKWYWEGKPIKNEELQD
jgi:choline-sulfatase